MRPTTTGCCSHAAHALLSDDIIGVGDDAEGGVSERVAAVLEVIFNDVYEAVDVKAKKRVKERRKSEEGGNLA